MTLLKLKSIFYRYTGVYLANEEENDYITSKEFWKDFNKRIKNPKNDIGPRTTQGILIGLWQSKHGFARPMSSSMFKRPKAFWRFMGFFECLYLTIKWDLQELFRRKK